MKALIIDTSTRCTLVIVDVDGNATILDNLPQAGQNTSSNIIPNVDRALSDAGITIDELDLVAAAVGPGSFTGLRIGVSVANAFGTLPKPLLGVNLLDVLRFGQSPDTLAALPSRPGFCYTDKGEYTPEEVAAAPSVGVEGTGAKCILSRSQYAERMLDYVRAHHADAACAPIEPLYLKKSQAERLRDNHD